MVYINCLRDGRDVDICLEIRDEDVDSASAEIIRMLEEDELSGELASGPYEFEVREDTIIFSNVYFGASITRREIEQEIENSERAATEAGYDKLAGGWIG